MNSSVDIKRNVLCMLHQRGYTILDRDIPPILPMFDTLMVSFNNLHIGILEHILIIYGTGKLGKRRVSQLLTNLDKLDVHHVTIVCDNITTHAYSLLERHHTPFDVLRVQLIRLRIMSHTLVPTYHVLSPQEYKALISKYGPLSTFPKMKSTDPVARYMNFRIGYVLRIVHRNGNIYYRTVIEG